MPTDPEAGARTRETWPDVAKGVCIVLVVLWHVVTKHYQQVDWNTSLPVSAAWGTLGEQLLPLRMPLFFTISGVFALGTVGRPWRVILRGRVATLLYVYALWLLIHTTIMWFTPDFDTARARDLSDLVEQLTITPTNLWYLYALALYVVIARATMRVPTTWLLIGSFVLSAVAAAALLPAPSNRGQVYQNLFFFLLGLRLRPRVETWAREANARRLVGWGGALVVGSAAMAAAGAQRWQGVWPAVSVLAVAFGVTAAAMLARTTGRVARGLDGLGRRTLPIYVIHLPLLAVVDLLLRGPLNVLEPRGTALAIVEPAVLTAVVLATCLALDRGLRRIGLRWLFERPTARRRPSAHPA